MPPDHLHGSPAVVVSANGKKRSCRLPASQQPRLKAAPGLLHPVSHALGSAFLSAAMPMLVVSLPTHMSTAMPNVLIRSFAINRTRTALVLASFLLLIGACAGTPPSWATMSPCNYVALPLRTYWEGSQGVDSLNVELSPQRNRDARTAVWKAASAARHLPPAPLPPSPPSALPYPQSEGWQDKLRSTNFSCYGVTVPLPRAHPHPGCILGSCPLSATAPSKNAQSSPRWSSDSFLGSRSYL